MEVVNVDQMVLKLLIKGAVLPVVARCGTVA